MGKGGQPGGEKIWVMERENDNWSEPKPLLPVINSLKIHWQFSVDRKGNLYFGVWKVDPLIGSTTDFNIYYSKYENREYGKPEKLGPEINNSQFNQYSPFVAPDGSYLIFTRQSKISEPQLILSIFISFREKDGSWSEAREIDEIIRMDNHDIAQPCVTPDGKYLVFQRVVGGHSIEL